MFRSRSGSFRRMGATFATGAVPLVLTVIALIAGTMGLGMVGHFWNGVFTALISLEHMVRPVF
ncbi:MAG: hypothetical protein QGH73_08760 [Rhodospirillales bacterium]|nr:hypothetical protein [Rhodospirillales bacterium]MDP6645340.1 hypothetical protein [Rhodospirillales bacterium]MDP6841756.1 hypothetical protein [Rhodospirillales bacterium]